MSLSKRLKKGMLVELTLIHLIQKCLYFLKRMPMEDKKIVYWVAHEVEKVLIDLKKSCGDETLEKQFNSKLSQYFDWL